MILERFKKISAFVFDVDGVLTNGQVLVTESGEQLRQFDIKDGYAVKKLTDLGYPVAVITGGTCSGVEKRLRGLGIPTIFTGVHEKESVLESWLKNEQIDPTQVLYMGDDMPDLPCLTKVGLPTCPADAVEEIKAASAYVSNRNGGGGAVRDVIEKTLKLQGKW